MNLPKLIYKNPIKIYKLKYRSNIDGLQRTILLQAHSAILLTISRTSYCLIFLNSPLDFISLYKPYAIEYEQN